MSVPIEFDFARGGYYFTRPITDLPLFQLTEAELISIFVAQKALEAYKGTAFEQPLRTGVSETAGGDRECEYQCQLGGFGFRDLIPAVCRLSAGRDRFLGISHSDPE
jgi:hypothetical protein